MVNSRGKYYYQRRYLNFTQKRTLRFRGARNLFEVIVLTSWGCHTMAQTGYHETTNQGTEMTAIYSLTVLEAICLKSRCHLSETIGRSFLACSWLLGVMVYPLYSTVFCYIALIFTSVVAWPSLPVPLVMYRQYPLCVSVFKFSSFYNDTHYTGLGPTLMTSS